MCLAVPGRIVHVDDAAPLRMGTVDFDGIRKAICLAYVPEAGMGDWVVVHAGFAISQLDEAEAHRVLGWLGADPPAQPKSGEPS
jgi:hydrogenase expression/formation protein HypC